MKNLEQQTNETLSEYYRKTAVEFFERDDTETLAILSEIRRVFRKRGYINPYHFYDDKILQHIFNN